MNFWSDFVIISDELFSQTANPEIEARYRTAFGRLYYYVFHYLNDFFLRINFSYNGSASTHQRVIDSLNDIIAKNTDNSEIRDSLISVVRITDSLRKERELADYNKETRKLSITQYERSSLKKVRENSEDLKLEFQRNMEILESQITTIKV